MYIDKFINIIDLEGKYHFYRWLPFQFKLSKIKEKKFLWDVLRTGAILSVKNAH